MAKVYLEDSELTAIGNAIRGKNGTTTKYLPSEMPAAITAIQSGGGGGELMQLEGDGGYICGYPGYYSNEWLGKYFAHWFKPNWGPVSRPEGLCYYMDISPIESIEFADVDLETDTYSKIHHQLTAMFRDAYGRTQPPILIGQCSMGTSAFASHYFERIPVEVTEQLVPSGYTNYYSSLCNGCYRLQDISGIKALSQREGFKSLSIPSAMYGSCFMLKTCYIPEFTNAISSSSTATFTTIFSGCRSLENIEWGNTSITNTSYRVTLDLSTNATGYWNNTPTAAIQAYGFGAPENEITDLDSYNALKDNPYAWTTDPAFSHLNHTNAVKIINNLPSLSYSGTLSFNGTEGSGYGDPISDLTEAEIAVATAKGWTVTIK